MTTTHTTSISVHGLTKQTGRLRAVEELTFEVRPGQITGFLGPNGAGKTTTLRTLLGLVRPSAGAALIGGRPYPWLPHPRRTAGAVLEATGAHPGRRARDHLRILAQVTGVPDGRVAEVCDQVGLAEPADRRVGRLLPRHAPAPRPGRGAARRPACLAEEHSPERRESTMKQYLLSIYQPDSDPPPADVLAEIMRDVRAADEELRSAARVGVLRRPSRAVVRAVTGHRG